MGLVHKIEKDLIKITFKIYNNIIRMHCETRPSLAGIVQFYAMHA